MSRRIIFVVLSTVMLFVASDLMARGGFRGGRGGGGRGGMSRSPSMSRSMSRPSPSYRGPSRSAAPRPTAGNRSVGGARPSVGGRPSGVSRPGGAGGAGRGRPGGVTGGRPSASQLNNFLDLGSRPSTGPGRTGGASIAAAASGTAAASFLRDSSTGNLSNRAAAQTARGQRAGVADRAAGGGQARSNLRAQQAQARSNLRAQKVDNVQQLQQHRQERRQQAREQFRDNHPRWDFWTDHPTWARWRLNRPYRWATWAAISSWFPYGWSEPMYYDYGESAYYEDGSVYYGDEAVATSDEYAEQAQAIADSGAGVPEDTQPSDWLGLGVFAITQDGEASGPPPNLILQLQVSKDGVITGTLQDMANNKVQQIEGAVDKTSQRSAWTVVDKSWPLMETGISNLTKDETAVLVHFEDGQVQQWLLVRMEDPDNSSN